MKRTQLPKWLCNLIGILCVIIAMIGVVVPLLPTTPLLLLAAACFLRGSERLHRWITTHPWFGKVIRDYQERRVVSRRTKVFALVVLWGSISYSAWVVIDLWWVRVLLLVIALGVSIHILSLHSSNP